MKKIISILTVAVLLVSALTISVFADTITPYGDNGTHEVKAQYSAGVKQDTYKVVITWGDMEFKYSTSAMEWNTEDHVWKPTGTDAWAPVKTGDDKISITNHSSQDITASFSFTSSVDTVTGGTFKNNGSSVTSITVGNAQGGTEVTKDVFFAPQGSISENGTIGQITVTLNK